MTDAPEPTERAEHPEPTERSEHPEPLSPPKPTR